MSLDLRIVSPEKVEFVGQVDRVVVPGTSGEFEILANHAPIISTLNNLVRQTRPGGIIAISFWEFMNDERMARKAVRAEARAELTPPFEGYDSAQFEAGDHLIGWQNDRHAYRYCHHFDDQQITDLVRGVRTFYKSGEVTVRELERFHADGRSGDLNRYVILKRL